MLFCIGVKLGLSQIFNDRVMRIFGSEAEEVAGDWRRLHNEELHKLHTPPNIIRVVT
jgi:hypothetical protein